MPETNATLAIIGALVETLMKKDVVPACEARAVFAAGRTELARVSRTGLKSTKAHGFELHGA